MANLRILDEGLMVQDACIEFNFVGAGVTATRPSQNDRVTVTIPSGADVAGWTRDVVPTTVRLTNVNDTVSIGAALAAGAEKVYINPTGGGPALRLGGSQIMPKTGTAAAAATQAASQLFRLTASMWTGAAEAERDWDIYAGPSSLAADEGGGAFAQINFDLEAQRILSIRAGSPTGAITHSVFTNTGVAGLAHTIAAFTFRAIENYGVGDYVLSVIDAAGGATPATLFAVNGLGPEAPKSGTAIAAASQSASRPFRLTASMWTGAAEAERDFDLYATPNRIDTDESVSAVAVLGLDYEGFRILDIQPGSAAPGAIPATIIRQRAPGGQDSFMFRCWADKAAGDIAFGVQDNEANIIANLLLLYGNGNLVAGGGLAGWGKAAPIAQALKINDPAGGGVIDVESRAAIVALIDVIEGMGASAL